MDQRNGTRTSVHRQPLGDATNRVNNAAILNAARHKRVDSEISDKPKPTTRGYSNPALSAYPPPNDHHRRSKPAVPKVEDPGPVNHRLSAITQDSRDTIESRRVSQFSNVSSNASTTRQLKTHIGPWQLGKTLGEGTSARVRLARHRVSHKLVAIKIVAKSKAYLTQSGSLANLDQMDVRNPTSKSDGGLPRMPLAIEREIAILKLIEHPNIIKLHDIWENRAEIYLVTEYVEKGDMYDFMNWNGPLNEDEAMYYFRQIMSALEYCHSLNICHRDLKPENILLKADGQVKIADFRMAALQQDPAHQLKTACGSPHYAAPELLRHQPYKGSAVDIWSMGVILFAMLAGRLPFDEKSLELMATKAVRGEFEMPPGLTREAKDLIRRIIVTQPSHRITMKQMWRHALIKKYNYLDDLQKPEGRPRTVFRNMEIQPILDDDIDPQILRQLKSLWHGYSEVQIREKLGQERSNDQKLFYCLLYNHRENQLENYNNDVPISKSDLHHVRPQTHGKRISTCEFTQPRRGGHARSMSRFTVISNFADADEVGTVRSYDPFNSSQILQPRNSQISHARIIVHRHESDKTAGSGPATVLRSYHSYKSVGNSFQQRQRMNSQRTNTTGQLKSPRSEASSIRSHHSTPWVARVKVNARSRRGVDFSSVRNKDNRQQHRSRTSSIAPASIVGDDTTYDRYACSPSSPRKQPKSHRTVGTRSMVDVGKPREDSLIWNEELQQLNHRIAKHCDEAFGSSLIISESTGGVGEAREASPFSLSLGTPSATWLPETPCPAQTGNRSSSHPWDTRPLPPVPSNETATPEWNRTESVNVEPLFLAPRYPKLDPIHKLSASERRAVSEPVYNHAGRDIRPLPSISENTPEDWRLKNLSKHQILDAFPPTPSPVVSTGVDYLTRVENTIRVVNSPMGAEAEDPVKVPEPLNVRKVSQIRPEVAKSTRSASRQSQDANLQLQDGHSGDNTAPTKKRVASWFKRSSKEDASNSSFVTVADTSFQSKETSSYANDNQPYRSDSRSTDRASMPQASKKKAFSFSFWKGAKNEPAMSLASANYEDAWYPEDEKSVRPKPSKKALSIAGSAAQSVWCDNDVGTRKIEVHQNWLSRLFRVKPATRYLCFTAPKRRARQEVAILLREWRKYGIKDVETDKERNIVFARVSTKNYLNLKEVSFAVELMTVIEHGKRNPLSIARFTQERGAASSFHKVVDAMNSTFSSRALLVTDKRKAGMMIKTLNS
ncbi:hypothetical protein B0T26DRAFT_30934 [Lasiosphaeria miniovina]|uniref:non-specific serine/threonine protein kinase n=1 Tax=Lasiosphaeria miniovina TaxID=1954250 RepID=A0AA40BG63_9PEZI|nr:uncharacterized protein B0T26DRAFT_30934 [Lasiosphaeria miniovina]KAK0733644.1 hypothetical protein B0T26DRAFT_30934 [Lasiosphaeria miniovina]